MEEFYELIPKSETSTAEPKKHKKHKLPKFSKSSWKHTMLEALKQYHQQDSVEKFHFTRMENLLICFGRKKSEVFASKVKFKKNMLKYSDKAHEDKYVLVNCNKGMYRRVSIEAYEKVCNIKRIGVYYTLFSNFDGMVETVATDEFEIENIQELMRFIDYVEHCEDGIYGVQCQCFGQVNFKSLYQIMVIESDNTVRTYKGENIDKFMKDYSLMN